MVNRDNDETGMVRKINFAHTGETIVMSLCQIAGARAFSRGYYQHAPLDEYDGHFGEDFGENEKTSCIILIRN